MVESLRGHHGTRHAVRGQRLLDSTHDFVLPILAQQVGGNHVGIVRGPVRDAHGAELADHLFERDRPARRRVKQRVAFIGGGPLRARNEILAARLG